MLNSICVSIQGASHRKDNRPLQDCSKVCLEKGFSIFSVADGHGGEKYFRSAKGSEIAVNVAEKELRDFRREFYQLREEKFKTLFLDKTIGNIENNILRSWKHGVRNHLRKNPLTNDEKNICKDLEIPLEQFEIVQTSEEHESSLHFIQSEKYSPNYEQIYGTTLIAGIYLNQLNSIKDKEALWIIIQIGDGKCLIRTNNGEIKCPIPEDEHMGFGITTSLCSSNAIKQFRHAYGFEKLKYICACTDGVQDSFIPDGLKTFTNDIYENIKIYGSEREQKELEDFLPRLSEQGSGDDVSLAGIFDTEDEATNTTKGPEDIT